ncbi:hypothetical protein K525DRAFT_267767 [Schizophyllum commune Loenen D]|nr:hypothetical protein K525DRAFT_267767 [Schizophyllum commune Loenen D]
MLSTVTLRPRWLASAVNILRWLTSAINVFLGSHNATTSGEPNDIVDVQIATKLPGVRKYLSDSQASTMPPEVDFSDIARHMHGASKVSFLVPTQGRQFSPALILDIDINGQKDRPRTDFVH